MESGKPLKYVIGCFLILLIFWVYLRGSYKNEIEVQEAVITSLQEELNYQICLNDELTVELDMYIEHFESIPEEDINLKDNISNGEEKINFHNPYDIQQVHIYMGNGVEKVLLISMKEYESLIGDSKVLSDIKAITDSWGE